MVCKNCGKEFEGKYSKWCTGNFCSRYCAHSFSTKEKRQEINEKVSKKLKNKHFTHNIHNAHFKQKIPKNCPICHNTFLVLPCKLKQIYCSKLCYIQDKHCLYRKKVAGGYRQGSGRSIGGYYKNIYCHSTYELAFVIWNLDHNIQFKKCDKIFEYFYNFKKHKYFPDFEINSVIYEIKGYWTETVDYKIKSVNDAGYEVKVLYLKDIRHMINYVKEKYNITHIEQLYEDYIFPTSICKNCNLEFQIKNKQSKGVFCSRRCSGLYRNKIRIKNKMAVSSSD